MEHELIRFEKCSLFNSAHAYSEGYSKAICKCGWKSPAARDETALVLLWQSHAKADTVPTQPAQTRWDLIGS